MTQPSHGDEPATLDPVCGERVVPFDAVASLTHGGQTYYFAHIKCKMLFEGAPDDYLIAGKPRIETHSPQAAQPKSKSTTGIVGAGVALVIVVGATAALWPVSEQPATETPQAPTFKVEAPVPPPEPLAESLAATTGAPQDPKLLYRQGRAELDKSDLQGAIVSFRAAVRAAPTFAAAHGALGVALQRAGHHEQAVRELLSYVGLAGDDDPEIDASLQAMIAASRQIHAAPPPPPGVQPTPSPLPAGNAKEYYRQGRRHLGEGQLAEAIDAYKKCIRLNRKFVDAYAALGVAYQRQGRHGMAANILMTYLRLARGRKIPEHLREALGTAAGKQP